MSSVLNNIAQSRYEYTVDGYTAFANYRLEGQTLSILHVEAPVALRGTGAAGRLMEGIVEDAKTRGLTIHPICSYAVAWMRKHKI